MVGTEKTRALSDVSLYNEIDALPPPAHTRDSFVYIDYVRSAQLIRLKCSGGEGEENLFLCPVTTCDKRLVGARAR